MACSWSAAFCGHEHGGVGVVARIVPAHRPFLPRDVCRPRFDVATFIANEDSLDCRGAPARGGTPPAALADRALLLHGLDPIPQRVVPSGGAAREAAAGTLGSISGFPSVAPKARIWRPFLASILRMSWHQLKACPRPRPTSRSSCTVFGFCYLLVWGYIADLSMVPRLRRGRLASRALRTPFISCAVKTGKRFCFLSFFLSLSTCAPDRPSKILLVQVWTLSSSPIPRLSVVNHSSWTRDRRGRTRAFFCPIRMSNYDTL